MIVRLFLILLILPIATPLIAEPPKRQTRIEPAWRVIDDAPFRVIPAHPPLKSGGETLEELGFESIEDVLNSVEQQTFHDSVAFSPDGRFIASGAWDKTVKLWDIETKRLSHSFEGHSAIVTSVDFSPDSRFIASSAWDNTVKLWDVEAKHLNHSFEGHSSSVYSVAFSPDGRFIASGAGDNTVKLWDIKKRIEADTLLGGQNGNWLSIDNQRRVLRGDDGTLLRTQNENGNSAPVPVSNLADQDALSIAINQVSTTLVPGETIELPITVKNNGPRAAFWLHVKPSQSNDASIRFDPPNNEIAKNAKGEQPWKPSRIAKLDPGESATLHALISPNLKLPADFIAPGIRKLTVTVISANGTEISEDVEVDVQSPGLQWRQATLEQDGQTLNVSLNNNGSLPLKDARMGLYIRSLDEAERNPGEAEENTKVGENSEGKEPGFRSASSRLLQEQLVADIPAAGTVKLAFVLPDDFDLAANKLVLSGMTRDLPIFAWDREAPEIEQASRVLLWLLVPILLMTLTALYYLRRYRHPLLVKLSNEPAALFGLHPEQLAEAKMRLKQTRRLKTVLSKTEVTAKTLDNSIDFVEKESPEVKAHWLAKPLGAELLTFESSSSTSAGDQTEAFHIWALRLSPDFPLNLDRCLVCFPSDDSEAKDFLNDLKPITHDPLQPLLLIGPDSDFRRILYESSKVRSNKFVSPSGQALTRLLIGPDPEKTLAEVFASQLSLTQLSPYQVGGGVNREIVFFGRREMIANIMNRDPANYLLVGGRQVGKSSLLKALERRYREHNHIQCFYLALSNEILIPRLASELKLSSSSSLDEIASHVAQSQSRFVFLIDEADRFIAHERNNDYQILDALRRMSEEGHCNFILAGFWELYQHAVLDYQSPLKNFAEIIQVGALEAEACRQLATEPMNTMGLQYASPALVDQLLKTTGQRANLISISCHEILNHLPIDQRIIHAADVHRALYSDKTLNALKGWGAMTDDETICRLDRIIVYTTIEKDYFDLAELVDELKSMNIDVEMSTIEHSLSRLELGFVLGRNDDNRYFYRVPLFREMIIKDSPSVKLKAEVENWNTLR